MKYKNEKLPLSVSLVNMAPSVALSLSLASPEQVNELKPRPELPAGGSEPPPGGRLFMAPW